MSHALLSLLRGSKIESELDDLTSKLQGRLSRSERLPPDLSRMFMLKSCMIRPGGIDGSVFDTLAISMLEQRRVTATYRTFTGSSQHIAYEPYTFVFSDHGVYCYGRMVRRDGAAMSELRLLSFERITNALSIDEGFVYPRLDKYNPHQIFEYCWGLFLPSPEHAQPRPIRVAFNPRWRAFLGQHRWHEHQSEPSDMEDGRVLVTFDLCPTHDFVRWLRGLGTDVDVLDPPDIREWITSGVDP